VGFNWKEEQRQLLASTLPIVVRAVNQRTGAASLDYTKHVSTGLRLIAVGGMSLSRGLTLEGLCVSYFFRITAANRGGESFPTPVVGVRLAPPRSRALIAKKQSPTPYAQSNADARISNEEMLGAGKCVINTVSGSTATSFSHPCTILTRPRAIPLTTGVPLKIVSA
jgi:hypothetical protein